MPEEIVYDWQTPLRLVNDLTLPEQERPDILARLYQQDGGTSHKFRFCDAKGQEIQFPIRLISDTTINNQLSGRPADVLVGAIQETGEGYYTLQVIDERPQ